MRDALRHRDRTDRTDSLSRFRAAFLLELRLICRHWSFLVLHVLWAFVLFASMGNRDSGTAQMIFETGLIFVVRTLISGVALFLTANTFARSNRVRFAALEDAFPTGAEVGLGRWAACTVAVLTFLIEPALMGLLRGPLPSFVAGVLPFALMVTILLAFATALAWLLVSVFGVRRWMFLVMAAVWIGLVIIPTFFQMSRVPFVGLFNLTGNGSPLNYTELFGTMPQGLQPFWFHLFYGALVGVLVVAALARLQQRRAYRIAREMIVIGGVGVLVVVLAMGGYSREVLTARAQDDHARAIFERHESELLFDTPTPEAITRYDIHIDLSDVSTPKYTVSLDIQNRSTAPLAQPRLTLHHALTLTDASEKYTRDADFITLTPAMPLAPGDSLTVNVTYSGALWLLDLFGGIPSANTFSNADGVRLPYLSCWVPMPGWVIPDDRYGRTRVMGTPARINLRISGASQMTFGTNLPATGERTFAAQSAQWVSVIGSPRLTTTRIESHLLYAAAFDQPALASLIETRYTPTLAAVQRFVPDVAVNGLIVFGTERAPLPFSNALIDGWMVVAANRNWASYMSAWGAAERTWFISDLLQPLFPRSSEPVIIEVPGGNGTVTGYGANSGVMEGIAQFIELHQRFNGDAAAIGKEIAVVQAADEQRMRPNPLSASPALTFKAITLESLVAIYAQGGEAAIIRTLRQIRTRQPELVALPSEKVGAWLQEASHVP